MLDTSRGEAGGIEPTATAEKPRIRLGTLLPGSVPLGRGTTRPRKGFVWLAENAQVAAIVKPVDTKGLAAEIFCAVLGRESDMSIPEPLLVKDYGADRLLFGSVYQEFPNLLQAFQVEPDNIPESQAIAILSKLVAWSQIDRAISFDEWIANADRHLQNLLWDGFDQFILIDHALSLGLRPRGRPAENCLLRMLKEYLEKNPTTLDRLKGRVLENALRFDPLCAREAAEVVRRAPIPAVALCGGEFYSFVTRRLPNLAMLLSKQFPSGQLELGGM